ncbi:MAG: hypothetical protein P4M12_03675 [Gammaproteobacteria bacterium]|nr:hypothetical protein [Gammaproteobacteria bacterium]
METRRIDIQEEKEIENENVTPIENEELTLFCDEYNISSKEKWLTRASSFIEGLGIGATIGYCVVGLGVTWAGIEVTTPIILALTGVSLVCAVPPFYKSYKEELRKRQSTIDKIKERKDILTTLKNQYKAIQLKYMSHIILTFDLCAPYYNPSSTESVSLEEKNYIDSFVNTAVTYVKENNVISKDQTNEQILENFKNIYNQISNSSKQNNKVKLTKEFINQFLEKNPGWESVFFNENENDKHDEAKNLTLTEQSKKVGIYVIKASSNYANIIAISGAIGSFTYGANLSPVAVAAFGSSILFAFSVQRIINYVNHEVHQREKDLVILKSEVRHQDILFQKIMKASGDFNLQRFRTKIHFFEHEKSSLQHELETENNKLKAYIHQLEETNESLRKSSQASQHVGLFKPAQPDNNAVIMQESDACLVADPFAPHYSGN